MSPTLASYASLLNYNSKKEKEKEEKRNEKTPRDVPRAKKEKGKRKTTLVMNLYDSTVQKGFLYAGV